MITSLSAIRCPTMLRPMTESDMDVVVDLLTQMYEESSNYQELEFSLDRVEEVARQTIQSGFAMLYEETGGKVVGVMAGVVYQPTFSRDLMAADLALYVHPDYRGFVAVRLVTAFITWAKSRGAKLISVGVTAGIDNDAAVKLYEILGFKKTGTSLMMEVI